jgi:adenylate cyclase
MGKEIERKFLVNPRKFIPANEKVLIRQGYISDDPVRTVRIRIAGAKSDITIKGKSNGITRDEFIYPVPLSDAEELINLSKNPTIEKIRYLVWIGGKRWEVDEFLGENEGLLMAEVELDSEDDELVLPDWLEKEVSGDERYFNSYLSKFPYKHWATVI